MILCEPILNKLQKITQLKLSEIFILLICFTFYPINLLLLQCLGYQKTITVLTFFLPSASNMHEPGGKEFQKISTLARMVSVSGSSQILYSTKCIHKSILLWFMISRMQVRSTIKFGVQKDDQSKLHAHAWVECAGVPLIDSLDIYARFSVFKNDSLH